MGPQKMGPLPRMEARRVGANFWAFFSEPFFHTFLHYPGFAWTSVGGLGLGFRKSAKRTNLEFSGHPVKPTAHRIRKFALPKCQLDLRFRVFHPLKFLADVGPEVVFTCGLANFGPGFSFEASSDSILKCATDVPSWVPSAVGDFHKHEKVDPKSPKIHMGSNLTLDQTWSKNDGEIWEATQKKTIERAAGSKLCFQLSDEDQ